MSPTTKTPFQNKTHFSFPLSRIPAKPKRSLSLSVKAELDNEKPGSASVVSEKPREEEEEKQSVTEEEEQEKDWKTDEEFKKFMGSPSIEAAIKLEKKRADRKLKELDRESSKYSDNPVLSLLNKALRDSLARDREVLEKVEQIFQPLDLNKVCLNE